MPKPSQKEQANPITALDKEYYECEIADLRKKLAHQRSHTTKLEERNEEMEVQMKQMEEDRIDVTAYLDRTLHEKISLIKDLEEKLSELAKVRENETKDFQKQIKEWELKFNAMQEELTSEIKLLTGKLNSLEEFRIQRDDLMAKFDHQESHLKEQSRRHKEILYEMERKQVIDKDRLKKEVENKLLELSNEFAKSNEIRISAHVQRLVRENIALNNELDRMMFSQRRLQTENEVIQKQGSGRQALTATFVSENATLIKTCDSQLEIIKKLTRECEIVKQDKMLLMEQIRLKENTLSGDHGAQIELKEFRRKFHILEQNVHFLKVECDSYMLKLQNLHQEKDRLLGAFYRLKFTIKSAMRGEEQPDDDPKFRAGQRQNLLSELMNIILTVENKLATVESIDTIPSISNVYVKGDLGITPRQSITTILDATHSVDYLTDEIEESAEKSEEIPVERNVDVEEIYETCPIIDLESGSVIVFSESSKDEQAQPEDDAGLDDDAEGFGVSSSDEEAQAPQGKS